ncbi:DUF4936 family protein [Aquabacterium sp.]|uniref:DUF4936 family protein n=1 Tax=Aquabacterium sp. TaxID=1872578 RepID=UPI00248934C1|nr:DUF4936 family protein [Aquabacterium sp.]MDI1259149.1 DUF4936 family protein [Aquabacterium sp.]
MATADAVPAKALFIYYKVDPAHAPAFEKAVRQMQIALRRSHEDLTARLWIRADAQASAQTWMETYEHPDGVSVLLATLIELAAQDLPAGQVGDRHVEMFSNID